MDVLPIIIVGLALLAALGWIIGRVEANARNGAWHRIAETRRDLHEKEQSIVACLSGPRCPDCPVNRYLTGRFGD